jgi:predicted dehydrogenase
MVFSVGGGSDSSQPSVNPQIAVAKPAITAEEPLLAEIKAFLSAVRERSRPVVLLEDGRKALQLGLEILAEIARHAGRIGVRKS